MIGELATAFGLGLLATLSPCALPLYPGFLAYLAAGGERLGSRRLMRWLGLFVLLGVLTPSCGSVRGGPLLSAYAYGLLYGPIALPCSGPLLVSIFALSLTVGSFAEKLLFFLAFGLGFGVPLLVLSVIAPARRSWLLRAFTSHERVFARVAGALLVAIAGIGLVDSVPSIQLYLGA